MSRKKFSPHPCFLTRFCFLDTRTKIRYDNFIKHIKFLPGEDFYTGVPDSQLKPLCNYLMDRYGIDRKHHIIAANEGNCAALAAGYHLATGKIPVVYMQNSGEGNIINPAASLLNDEVYAIPVIFIIGWRGEPGVPDEPQHIYQGKVTIKLLEDMDIAFFLIGKETTENQLKEAMNTFDELLKKGKNVAFIVKKGGLHYDSNREYKNDYTMSREEIIRHIVSVSEHDPIFSTTGKASRELFEIREELGHSHKYDFLTVGSMGHCSSIALGAALQKTDSKIWCIDGDGALLMHMGSLAVLGQYRPSNLIHIVINNSSHETVGGMPTVAGGIDLPALAAACGYPCSVKVHTYDELDVELRRAKNSSKLSFIEAKCNIGSRETLGRPTTTALENKQNFMRFLQEL